MSHREILMQLAHIDELVGLRDRIARRSGEKCAYAVRLLDETIDQLRANVRVRLSEARFAALPGKSITAMVA